MAFLSGVSCCASMIDVQLLICRSQSTSDLPVQLRHQSSSCALAGAVRSRAAIRAKKSERTIIIMLQQLVPTILANIELSNSRVSSAPGLVGLGVGPSLFPFPKVRGCGAPEQTPEEDTRLSSAPPAFPAFAFHGARTRAAHSSRRGCSGVRPGVQLRTTPAGAGPAPPS